MLASVFVLDNETLEWVEIANGVEGKEIEYSGKYGLVIFQEDKMEEKLDGKEVF